MTPGPRQFLISGCLGVLFAAAVAVLFFGRPPNQHRDEKADLHPTFNECVSTCGSRGLALYDRSSGTCDCSSTVRE